MRTLQQHLSQYALYHRDQRNIYTHYVGIPLIVISIIALLSFPLAGTVLSPAYLLLLLVALFYLWLDVKFGLLMLLFLTGCTLAAWQLNQWAGAFQLWAALGVFVLGWLLQFVGHYFEGKKPAFVDDLSGLVIGPLFVVAEWCFSCGFAKQLAADIVAVAGPIRATK